MNITKEKRMTKTLERFIEEKMNNIQGCQDLINELYSEMFKTFKTYKCISLGDIFDEVTCIINKNSTHTEVPSYEYYSYGYTFETGFKVTITGICNLYTDDPNKDIHFVFKFEEPIKLKES